MVASTWTSLLAESEQWADFPKKINSGEEGHKIRLYSEEHKWGRQVAGRDWRGEMCYVNVRGRQMWREDSGLSATDMSGRPRARCVSGKGSVVRIRDQATA